MEHLTVTGPRRGCSSPCRPRRRATSAATCPGWVLITVMTAGLVAVLWAIARDQLSSMLRDALSSVPG